VYLHKLAASPEPRSDGVFYYAFGFLLEYFIEMTVRITGRRTRPGSIASQQTGPAYTSESLKKNIFSFATLCKPG